MNTSHVSTGYVNTAGWLEFAAGIAGLLPALGLFWLALRGLNHQLERRSPSNTLRVPSRTAARHTPRRR